MENNVIQFPAARMVKADNALGLTEEEQAIARENLAQHYAEQQAREEAYRADAREIDPETFAARVEYQASKQEPTQNAEGVRVGDLFYASWGYEQTNIDFFQVVALKGTHTAILRQIGSDYVGGYGYSGNVRPARNHFTDEEQYTVRTRKSRYYQDERAELKAPHISGNHYLTRTTDDAEHAYSSYY